MLPAFISVHAGLPSLMRRMSPRTHGDADAGAVVDAEPLVELRVPDEREIGAQHRRGRRTRRSRCRRGAAAHPWSFAQPVPGRRRHVLVAERQDQVEVGLAPEELDAGAPRRQRHVLLGEHVEQPGGHRDPSQPRGDAVRRDRRCAGSAPPRRARPAARPGRRSPSAGGPLSAGAGIPPGGALSAGAGIPPAGGSFCARATEAKPDSTSRAAHSGRVMDVSGLGCRERARLYTRRSSFRSVAPPPSSGRLAGSDVLLCGNSPRTPENILKTAICRTRGK